MFLSNHLTGFNVTSGEAPRAFTISPAVSGKTFWDLDIDGQFLITTAGTWTLTPEPGFFGDVTLRGAGGGGGGQAASGSGALQTTFAGLACNGGAGGIAAASGGSGGAGGAATGGDTNTAGGNGGNGAVGTAGAEGTPPGGGTVGRGGRGFAGTPEELGGGGGGAGGRAIKTYVLNELTPGSPQTILIRAGGGHQGGFPTPNPGGILIV